MSIDLIFTILFGTKYERDVKRLTALVAKINSFEPGLQKLSIDDIKLKTSEFKSRVKNGEPLQLLLPEAFGLVREAAVRTLGIRFFDVQLMGAIVLHEGKIAEMKTGEGKTFVATMPAYLNALAGEGVHIITVNDYLAKRDAEWMRPVYSALGLTVGVIQQNMDIQERQKAYNCDVTYGINSEFGFDYLRDNMALHKEQRVQRKLRYAIIDEADSILIDEARTPLIISGEGDVLTHKYILVDKIVSRLEKGRDYVVNPKEKTALLTDHGIKKVENRLKIGNLYDVKNFELAHLVNQSVKAHALFKRDVDYIINCGEVIIVDEFTGRLMHGRRYSEGIHEALEAKEHVTIAKETITMATITLQNYFRMYQKLAGMTGTADSEAVELKKIFGLEVVVIPTNEPMIRVDHPDRIYDNELEKFHAIVNEIEIMVVQKRPVLVGTISVKKSEMLSSILKRRGIAHSVLNAKNHAKEAEIIAGAGRPGTVTIATNMAGRGTDIILGGRRYFIDEIDLYPEVFDHRIWQKFKTFILHNDFDAASYLCDKMVVNNRQKASEIIQKGREWVAIHEKVVRAGGLHVIGTERHEAGRIDNQLRGRAGRQGDPGSSVFYVSLEDELISAYGAKKVPLLRAKLEMEERQEIQSRSLRRAIDDCQKEVVRKNFSIRKHLLEYDEVLDSQRLFVYEQRNKILNGEDVRDLVIAYIKDVCRIGFLPYIKEKHIEVESYEMVASWLKSRFMLDFATGPIVPQVYAMHELADIVEEMLLQQYADKEEQMGMETMRQLERMIMLQVIDSSWVKHLQAMEELQDGIWTEGYSGHDPAVEYKIEGFKIYNEFLYNMKLDIIEFLLKVKIDSVAKLEEADYIWHNDKEPIMAVDIKEKNKEKHASYITVGGVKRKKNRRSRRNIHLRY